MRKSHSSAWVVLHLLLLLLLPLPYVGDDVVLHNGDVGTVVPAHDRHAVRAHQELLKVPLDVVVPQRFPEEILGVPKLLCHWGTGVLQSGWGGVVSASLPCPTQKTQAGCCPLITPCCGTYLQEGENLLLLGPIHIPFLEELEVGDKATPWPDMPARGGCAGCHAMGSSWRCTGWVGEAQALCFRGPEPQAERRGVTARSCSPCTHHVAGDPSPAGGCQVPCSPCHSTHLSAGRISEFWPGSCFPNWLEGKPRTTSP